MSPAPSSAGLGDLPAGAKLRVRYGRGRNQREYEAKVCDISIIQIVRSCVIASRVIDTFLYVTRVSPKRLRHTPV